MILKSHVARMDYSHSFNMPISSRVRYPPDRLEVKQFTERDAKK